MTVDDQGGMRQLARVSSLVKLKIVGRASDISPLASLSGLDHLEAWSPITVLPAVQMPALRHLWILDAPASDREVARFARLNPQCTIDHGRKNVLLRVVGSADRVRVIRYKGCGTSKKDVQIARGVAVQRLFDAIEIAPSEVSLRIACFGDVQLEFYAGDERLGRLSYFTKNGMLRFSLWPSDTHLTAKSAAQVQAWLNALAVDDVVN